MPTDTPALTLFEAEEAEFNRSWTDGRRGPPFGADAGYIVRRRELANQRDNWAAEIERLSRERDTGVPEGWREAVQRIRNTSMQRALAARVPECGHFGSIAQDADWLANEMAAAPQPPTVSTQGDMLIPMGRENDGDKHVTAYMCLIDFECELGLASGGNRVYPSIEDIREHSKCVGGCGIVEVEVRATRVVQEPSDEGELVMTAAEIEAAEHSPPSPQPDLSTLTRERDQAREALARTERNRDMWKDQCARQADLLSAINELPQECVNSLTHQRQIDMDGCEVGVSRQAVDEIHAALMRARSVLDPEKEEKA